MEKTLQIKKSNVPLLLLLVALLFFGLGSLALLAGIWPGAVAMLLALPAFFYWNGTELDFESRRVREFSALGPLRFGTWQNIHPGNETRLRSVRMAHSRTSRSMQTHTYHNHEFKLMIRLENGKFALLKRSENHEELEKLESQVLERL